MNLVDNDNFSLAQKLELVPMLKIFVFLVAGVMVSANFSSAIMGYCVITTILLSICYFIFSSKLRSFFVYLILFSLGASLGWLQKRDTLPLFKDNKAVMICIDTTTRNNAFICKVQNPKEKILLLIQDKSLQMPCIGDTLDVTVNIEPLSPAHYSIKRLIDNHNVERYAKVRTAVYDPISEKNIEHTYNIRKNKNSVINTEISWSLKAKMWCESRLSTLSVTKEDKTVLKGMVLGERRQLDRGRMELYQDSGISHYLAISGMHISILFMMLNVIFFWSGKFFRARVIKSVIIVCIIWAYTLMVGSPVSAIRAATMFSLMQVMMIRLTSPFQIFNSLFAVATLLVICEREVIHNIGFQLSFMAVLSILLFMPLFINVIPDKKVIKLWLSPLFLTISAQVMTIPIVLYHFGYISFVSPITNVIASVLLVPIFILATIYILFPLSIFDWAITKMFDILNESLTRLTDMRYSVIDNLDIGVLGVVIWLVISLMAFSQLSKGKIRGI